MVGRLAASLAALIAVAAVAAGSAASRQGHVATLEGKLVVAHSDNFRTGHATYSYRLLTKNGSYTLRLPDRSVVVPRANRVAVTGMVSGRGTTVVPGGLRAVSALLPAASGSKKIAVILFNFADNATQPYTPDQARTTVLTHPQSVAAYYHAVSWGKLDLTGDVFGWYSIPDTSTTCNYTQWSADAERAAQAAGVDLSGYDYKLYAFPSTPACPWSGISVLGGTQAWVQAMGVGIVAHELGHVFGVHHASSYMCTQNGVRVALAASGCSIGTEYGDPFSVMGSSPRGQTNFARATFGWMPSSDMLDVTSSGTYTLGPIESAPSGGLQAIRIARSSGSYLLLEFRQPDTFPDTFAASDPVVNGVTIRVVPAYGVMQQTKLVDTTPDTSSYWDAPLTAGRSVTDPVSGVTITTVATSSLGATVQIDYGSASAAGSGSGSSPPPTDTQPPTAPPSLNASAMDPTDVSLHWSGSTDNVAVAGYKVYRRGAYVTTSTSTSYTDSKLTPSTAYTYAVTAVDTTGNESTTSPTASATTPAPAADTTAPSAPTGLTARALDTSKIALAWSASTDNVGVTGYKVFRGSVLVATTAMTSWTDAGLATNTTYSYSVRAVDAAGNLSAASNAASARTVDLVAPSTPVALKATVVDVHHVALAWSASTDNVAVTGYKLYRNGTYLRTVTGTSYTDSSLVANTTYTYRVSARDAAGLESGLSDTATVSTTDTTPPTAPVLSAKIVNGTSPYVLWSASSDNDKIARYTLYRNGVLIATVGAGQRNYTDRLAPRGVDSYRVVVFDPAGNSAVSNTFSLTF